MRKTVAIGAIVPLLAFGGVAAFLGTSAPTTEAAVPGYCAVTITSGATTAQAHPGAGCQGPYVFKSWAAHGPHQTLFDTTTSYPWIVNVPPCAWQVDLYEATTGRLPYGVSGESRRVRHPPRPPRLPCRRHRRLLHPRLSHPRRHPLWLPCPPVRRP